MNLFIKDDELLKKYHDIWYRISNSIKKKTWLWAHLQHKIFENQDKVFQWLGYRFSYQKNTSSSLRLYVLVSNINLSWSQKEDQNYYPQVFLVLHLLTLWDCLLRAVTLTKHPDPSGFDSRSRFYLYILTLVKIYKRYHFWSS